MKPYFDHSIQFTEEEQAVLDLVFETFLQKILFVVEQHPGKSSAIDEFEELKDKVYFAIRGRDLH